MFIKLERRYLMINKKYSFIGISDHNLKLKIKAAYFWLIAHDDPFLKDSITMKMAVVGNPWNYSPVKYDENLNFYEQAVDEIKRRGYTEKECWKYNDDNTKIEDMSVEEIVVTMI